MSKTIYPNSATRKLYGQSGEAMQRQNKRFMSIQERLNKQASDKEKELRGIHAVSIEEEKKRHKDQVNKILIGFSIVIALMLALLILL